MEDEIINEELSIQNERVNPARTMDSKTFTKPVSELRFPNPVTLDIEESVQDAIMFMQMKQFGCILITKGEELVGILTERDIISKAIGAEKDFHSMKVSEIMTPNPESFQAHDTIGYIMKAMAVGGFRHVPIIDKENHPVGVVSVKDIVNFIVEHFAEDVLNLPPKPILKTDTREGA